MTSSRELRDEAEIRADLDLFESGCADETPWPGFCVRLAADVRPLLSLLADSLRQRDELRAEGEGLREGMRDVALSLRLTARSVHRCQPAELRPRLIAEADFLDELLRTVGRRTLTGGGDENGDVPERVGSERDSEQRDSGEAERSVAAVPELQQEVGADLLLGRSDVRSPLPLVRLGERDESRLSDEEAANFGAMHWYRKFYEAAADADRLRTALREAEERAKKLQSGIEGLIADIDSECPTETEWLTQSQWWSAMDAVRSELRKLLPVAAVSSGPTPTEPEYAPKVGDRVRCTLEGELTSYDEEFGVWILLGFDAAPRHVEWAYRLHCATTFTPVAAASGLSLEPANEVPLGGVRLADFLPEPANEEGRDAD